MDNELHYSISSDKALLDVPMIHDFISHSYWAKNIPLEIIERSIQHSLCFGAYFGKQQVGFARVITDYATFGYIADVFVLPAHRGHGVSKLIMAAIQAHPDLQGLRRMVLATQDAHGLYAQFGFEPLAHPEMFMTIHRPGLYSSATQAAQVFDRSA